MSLIYYNSINSDSAGRLQKILEAEVLTEKIETCQSVEEFSDRLCRTNHGQSIAVILISAMTEFYELFSIRMLLNDIRVILILPDRSSEIISAGYKLHPRFISYVDTDFKEVAVVLRRMIKLVEQRTIMPEKACPGLH